METRAHHVIIGAFAIGMFAAAIAFVLFVVILLATAVQFRVGKERTG
jgi:ABC-type sugar transport system permease subunit